MKSVILIVEDDSTLRELMSMDFKMWGYDVLQASNGIEAFTIIQKQKVDMVLSDVRMPGGGGDELLQRVHAEQTNVPMMMLISGFNDLTIQQAHEMGAKGFFSKPYDRKRVKKAVQDLLAPTTSKSEAGLRVDFQLDYRFGTESAASLGRVIQMSPTSFLVADAQRVPKDQDEARFELFMPQGGLKLMTGSGVVECATADSFSLKLFGEVRHL